MSLDLVNSLQTALKKLDGRQLPVRNGTRQIPQSPRIPGKIARHLVVM